VASVPSEAFGFYEFTTQGIPDAFDGVRAPSAFGYGLLETSNGSVFGLLELEPDRKFAALMGTSLALLRLVRPGLANFDCSLGPVDYPSF
jgi:hypothetical protein